MSEPAQKDQNVNQFNKFLQNNNDFLQQKYQQYFNKPTILIKQFNKQSAIKYIYDVFSFSKYESDQKMNSTLQKSLTKNIQDFLAILTKRKSQFNNKTAIQLLKYCIENNQMFAVKYDKKDKKIKTEQHMSQSALTDKQEKQKQKQMQKNQSNLQEHKQQPQEQNKSQQNDGAQNEENQQDKNQQQDKNNENENHINQFDETHKESPQRTADPELIKKNLKLMFEFYCKQQQNVGANTTFDRISYECKTMTLGKFLSFATATNIINDKIDKNLLMRKFKLVAQGKKQIQFQNFYEIVQTISAIDEALIPKLGVDEKIAFKNKLKERYIPFNTKDHQTTRDIKRQHIFVPKLTGHSGKLSDALLEEMKIRKQMKAIQGSKGKTVNVQGDQVNGRTPLQNKRYQSGIRNQLKEGSQIIASPSQLVNSNIRDFQDDLSFLEKMVNAEDADEQWLKQYKLPHKKIANLPPRLMSRKESIVPNLKKRVQELERSETRQTAHLQRRQYLSSNRQKQRNSRSVLN